MLCFKDIIRLYWLQWGEKSFLSNNQILSRYKRRYANLPNLRIWLYTHKYIHTCRERDYSQNFQTRLVPMINHLNKGAKHPLLWRKSKAAVGAQHHFYVGAEMYIGYLMLGNWAVEMLSYIHLLVLIIIINNKYIYT